MFKPPGLVHFDDINSYHNMVINTIATYCYVLSCGLLCHNTSSYCQVLANTRSNGQGLSATMLNTLCVCLPRQLKKKALHHMAHCVINQAQLSLGGAQSGSWC